MAGNHAGLNCGVLSLHRFTGNTFLLLPKKAYLMKCYVLFCVVQCAVEKMNAMLVGYCNINNVRLKHDNGWFCIQLAHLLSVNYLKRVQCKF